MSLVSYDHSVPAFSGHATVQPGNKILSCFVGRKFRRLSVSSHHEQQKMFRTLQYSCAVSEWELRE
jgi:hypothetical protein